MPSDRSDRGSSTDDRPGGGSKQGLRGASLGIELAAALIGFALLGFWIDYRFGTTPWGTLACVALGLVGGFYNFIRSSLTILRGSPVDRSADDDPPRTT